MSGLGAPTIVVAALVVAALMDGWAALLHGVIWHGPLYFLHESHHTPRRGWFERNDVLSLLHAPIAIALVVYGSEHVASTRGRIALGAGIGMTAFGLGYVLVHDGLVHKRLPVAFLARIPGLGAVARAHRVHHTGARGGAPYGLFSGPLEMWLRQRLARTHAPPTPPRDAARAPARPSTTPQGAEARS